MSRYWKRILIGIALVAVVVVIGDLIYSIIIGSRLRAWETTVKRDANGVQEGCGEFSMGDGKHAILLIHGINDSPACYREMAKSLADRGYRCRAMRLPGFAEKTEVYGSVGRAQWLREIEAEAKSLRQDSDHLTIVAHSLGGALTVRFLREHPDAADSVVLLAPAINVSSARSPILSPAAWHQVGDCILHFTQYTESPFTLDAKVATDETYPYRSPFVPRTAFHETFALIAENRDRAGELTAPLLMVLSPDDQVIDTEAAATFYKEVPSNVKELYWIEDTGHAMTVDHKWPEVVDRIDEFLTKLGASTRE